ANRFARHSAHSPSTPGVPPHAHLRCNNPLCTGVKEGLAVSFLRVCTFILIASTLHTPTAPPASQFPPPSHPPSYGTSHHPPSPPHNPYSKKDAHPAPQTSAPVHAVPPHQ